MHASKPPHDPPNGPPGIDPATLRRRVGGWQGRLGWKRSLPQLGPRDELELGMAGEKILHLIAVLRRQNRAGDIGEAAAGLDKVSAFFKHGLLFAAPRLQHRGER